MIVPKIVSHVQPTGRNYGPCSHVEAHHGIAGSPNELGCDECGHVWRDVEAEVPAPLELLPVEAFADVAEPSLNLWWAEPEAGRTTVGGALLLLAACFLAGLFVALSMLGADIQNGGDTFTTWTDRNFR